LAAVGVPVTASTRRLSAAMRRFLEQECFVVLALAAGLALTAYALPALIGQDTWVALVDGRFVAQHGLPRVDDLTVMTHGARWLDQQWLAHLTLYGLARAGGIRLTLGAGLAATFAALGLTAWFGRRAGGSARSVALLVAAPLCVAPGLLQLRTQTLAVPLFVAVYGLLAADSRRPSRHVWLVLPLLVVWANIHGSVVLGAALVAIHGLLLVRRRVGHGLALVVAAPATVLASPYGFAVAGYYHWMFLGSPLRRYVAEWQPAKLMPLTALFFVAGLALVFGLGRHGGAVSLFERIALPLLFLAGLASVRNGTWLALAGAVSGPSLLDAAWRPPRPLPEAARRINRVLACSVISLAAVVVAASLGRPAGSFESAWPVEGARAVAIAAGSHGLVLADDEHADWLLWKEPQLAGRIGYDVRFELLSPQRLAQLFAFRHSGGQRRLAAPYSVLTFVSAREAAPWRTRARTEFAADGFVVLSRR
jgi:hypothetical protein